MLIINISKKENIWQVTEEIDNDDDSTIRYSCESYEDVVKTINEILAANHPDQTKLTEWLE